MDFSSLLLQSIFVTRKQYQLSLLQVDLTDFLVWWTTYFLVLVLFAFPGGSVLVRGSPLGAG